MRLAPLLILLAACSRPPPAPPPPPPPPPAVPEAPPEPQPLALDARALAPDGTAVPLAAGSATEIAPGSTLELRSELSLSDFRVRLTGEDGRVVPSRDQADLGAGTRYRVRPDDPLPPGSRFHLEVGPDQAEHVRTVDGKEFLTAAFELRTTGDKPPPPPARRRRHRR